MRRGKAPSPVRFKFFPSKLSLSVIISSGTSAHVIETMIKAIRSRWVRRQTRAAKVMIAATAR
jgi:hypothetical protein